MDWRGRGGTAGHHHHHRRVNRPTNQATSDGHQRADIEGAINSGVCVHLHGEVSDPQHIAGAGGDRAAKLHIGRAILGDQRFDLVATALGDTLPDRLLIAGEDDPHLLSRALEAVERLAGQGGR